MTTSTGILSVPLGWDRICCLDPRPAVNPSAGKGLMGERIMPQDIKGGINLGAPLSTEALPGFPGLPVSPTSKPTELGFPGSFPNSLLILLMCLVCPGPYFGNSAGQGMPPGLGVQRELGGLQPAFHPLSPRAGWRPQVWVPPPGMEHLPVPSEHQVLEVTPKVCFPS